MANATLRACQPRRYVGLLLTVCTASSASCGSQGSKPIADSTDATSGAIIADSFDADQLPPKRVTLAMSLLDLALRQARPLLTNGEKWNVLETRHAMLESETELEIDDHQIDIVFIPEEKPSSYRVTVRLRVSATMEEIETAADN